jgi:ABC-type dipeptide/oligopeptide/nickel transport system ATPase component
MEISNASFAFSRKKKSQMHGITFESSGGSGDGLIGSSSSGLSLPMLSLLLLGRLPATASGTAGSHFRSFSDENVLPVHTGQDACAWKHLLLVLALR